LGAFALAGCDMTQANGKWQGKASRHERGYGTAWNKIRNAVMQRDQHLCQPCLMMGRPTPAREVDHIIPKSQGGTDDMDNLQCICTECHKDKTQQEARTARGIKPLPQFDAKGWPVWPH
jgi:5-methylcytosine-specific restriction enzyme A